MSQQPLAPVYSSLGMQQYNQSPSVRREVAFPAHGLPDPRPGIPVDHTITVSRDQERAFTYLKTDTMHAHQWYLPTPTIYIAQLDSYAGRIPRYRLDRVWPNVKDKTNGKPFELREITPGELCSFMTQTKGCDVVFLEDRATFAELEWQQTMDLIKEGAVVVREEPISYPIDVANLNMINADPTPYPTMGPPPLPTQISNTEPPPTPISSMGPPPVPASFSNMSPPPVPISSYNMSPPPVPRQRQSEDTEKTPASVDPWWEE